MTVTLDFAASLADTVMMYRARSGRWYLPSARDRMIEAAWNIGSDVNALVTAFEQICFETEIDDPGSDPCDECQGDKWFYYHPAMVL